MNFKEKLNNIMDIIEVNNKELSEKSNISQSTISRYRSGERVPKFKSKQLNSLIKGLTLLSKNKLSEDYIKKELYSSLNQNDIDFETFKNNLNILIDTLNINISDLSKYIGFDSSYISKIRNGKRIPQNINDLVEGITKYIISNYNNKTIISNLINSEFNEEALKNYIINNKNNNYNQINEFLEKLDTFNLNEYIKSINFDKIKIPTIPIQISKSKTYYGLDGYKNSQLDTLKTIALSKNKDDIFFYSNMSIIEASKDKDFVKKFMFGIAILLKKGLYLNMVHDLDRPLKELIIGLEGWIPIYMTGQIRPYYFKDNSNILFSNIICTSGNVILNGSYVTGDFKNSRFYLSTKKEDVSYYNKVTESLLKKATYLMNIYTSKDTQEFSKLLNDNKYFNNTRKNIILNLPNYIISNELLDKILSHNNIPITDRKNIIKWIDNEKNTVKEILINSKVIDEISLINEVEFNSNPCKLDLSKYFYDKEITYTYSEYIEHLELIKNFKKENKNYDFKLTNDNIFKNINIHIIKDKQVIISKTNNPITHFVIYHPRIVNAIQNFNKEIN